MHAELCSATSVKLPFVFIQPVAQGTQDAHRQAVGRGMDYMSSLALGSRPDIRLVDIRLVIGGYFLSMAVPAFSTLLPDFSISLAAFCVFLACSL